MKKVWVIIKREYLIRVRTKAFIIGTIISPLLMLGLILLPAFLERAAAALAKLPSSIKAAIQRC